MNPINSQTIPNPKASDSSEHDSIMEVEEEEKVPQQQNEEEIKATDDPYARFKNYGPLSARGPPPPPRPWYLLTSDDDDSDEELARLDLTREEWNAYLTKYPGRSPREVRSIRFSECFQRAFAAPDPPIMKSRRKVPLNSDCCDDIFARSGFIEKYGGGFKDEDDADGFKDEIVVNSGTSGAPSASNTGENDCK